MLGMPADAFILHYNTIAIEIVIFCLFFLTINLFSQSLKVTFLMIFFIGNFLRTPVLRFPVQFLVMVGFCFPFLFGFCFPFLFSFCFPLLFKFIFYNVGDLLFQHSGMQCTV